MRGVKPPRNRFTRQEIPKPKRPCGICNELLEVMMMEQRLEELRGFCDNTDVLISLAKSFGIDLSGRNLIPPVMEQIETLTIRLNEIKRARLLRVASITRSKKGIKDNLTAAEPAPIRRM